MPLTLVDSHNNAADIVKHEHDALLEQAIRSVKSGDRVTWVAKELGLSEQLALTLWADYYAMRAMAREELAQVQPDFDLITFADCQKRGCILGYRRGRCLA